MKKKEKKPLSKGAKAILTIIFILAAALLAFCAYKIIGIQNKYKEAENYYDSFTSRLEAGALDKKQEEMITEEAVEIFTESEPADEVVTEVVPEVVTEAETEPEEIPFIIPEEFGKLTREDIARIIKFDQFPKSKDDFKYDDPEEVEDEKILDKSWRKHASIDWDYDVLYEMCQDGIGYIFQHDKISYPMVQAEDNDKYLRHFIDGTYSLSGTIFMDYHFRDALESNYAVVYGHNMDDKSMFGSITAYKDVEYLKKHPYFEIYTPEGQFAYYVYAAGVIPIDSYVFSYGMEGQDYLDHMERIANDEDLNPYEHFCPVEITEDSKVLVLSTCIDYPRDYNYRYVVVIVRGEPLLEKIETKTDKK